MVSFVSPLDPKSGGIWQPLKENQFRIPKSRYDSVDVYISTDSTHRPEYDDIPVPYDEKIFKRLREHGMWCLIRVRLVTNFKL
jgi:hypothetical protein